MDEWINTVDQGTAVEVRTAHRAWIAAVADSRVGSAHDGSRRIHDFPIIWVIRPPGTHSPRNS